MDQKKARVRQKITQTQSSIAIDEDMRAATEKVAATEVEVFKAQSAWFEALDKGMSDEQNTRLLNVLTEKRTIYLYERTELQRISITSLEKIMNPKLLQEYDISID